MSASCFLLRTMPPLLGGGGLLPGRCSDKSTTYLAPFDVLTAPNAPSCPDPPKLPVISVAIAESTISASMLPASVAGASCWITAGWVESAVAADHLVDAVCLACPHT